MKNRKELRNSKMHWNRQIKIEVRGRRKSRSVKSSKNYNPKSTLKHNAWPKSKNNSEKPSPID